VPIDGVQLVVLQSGKTPAAHFHGADKGLLQDEALALKLTPDEAHIEFRIVGHEDVVFDEFVKAGKNLFGQGRVLEYFITDAVDSLHFGGNSFREWTSH
jgi:hypothetical protein